MKKCLSGHQAHVNLKQIKFLIKLALAQKLNQHFALCIIWKHVDFLKIPFAKKVVNVAAHIQTHA